MPQFLIELYDDPSTPIPPEDFPRAVGEYSAWAQRMGEEGVLVDGYKLTHDGGKVVTKESDGLRVVDGPYAETKEVLGGVFLIRAEDYGRAVEIARSCPHLEFERKLCVRMVDDLGAG